VYTGVCIQLVALAIDSKVAFVTMTTNSNVSGVLYVYATIKKSLAILYKNGKHKKYVGNFFIIRGMFTMSVIFYKD